METIALRNGVEMPLLGYGVLQMKEPRQCEKCVQAALESGYRMFDTAASYGNEEPVGRALKKYMDEGKVRREELFVITKLWIDDAREDSAGKAFETSLAKLGLDYIDLYLVHQPYGDYYGAWRAMEKLYEEGRIRALGVSNFSPERLVDLCMNQEIKPMVNQIEIHPFFQQKAIDLFTGCYRIDRILVCGSTIVSHNDSDPYYLVRYYNFYILAGLYQGGKNVGIQ